VCGWGRGGGRTLSRGSVTREKKEIGGGEREEWREQTGEQREKRLSVRSQALIATRSRPA